MRTFIAAASLAFIAITAQASAQDDLPRQDCSKEFVSRWAADPERMLSRMPKSPCWMRTKSGPYVCYKDGCARAHVYFEG